MNARRFGAYARRGARVPPAVLAPTVLSILGGSARLFYEAQPLAGGTPVAAAINYAAPGPVDLAQASAPARPLAGTVGGVPVWVFAGGQYLIKTGAPPVIFQNDHVTLWAIGRRAGTGANETLIAGGNGVGNLAQLAYISGGIVRALVTTNVGLITASAALTDTTALHVIRGRTSAAGIHIKIDNAAEVTNATPNTGFGIANDIGTWTLGSFTTTPQLTGEIGTAILGVNVPLAAADELQALLVASL